MQKAPYLCQHCGSTDPENFYPRMKSNCKDCHNKKRGVYNRTNKELALEYKGNKCQCCGYDKCIAALEFHHLDPSAKDPNFVRMKNGQFEKMKPELDKCILVCSNCHREIHAGLLNL